MVVKALAMKCRWQIQKFRPYAENIICFIDEPILSAFGVHLGFRKAGRCRCTPSRDDPAIHADGGIAGIHCCGNTEWSIPIDAGVDIVNFDAFRYAETIAMYPDPMKDHLQRNGILAWGVVPTSVAIREQTIDRLSDRLEKAMDHLASKGIEKQLIIEQAVITPSCGTGSMTPADAEQVFRLTGALSREMRRRYGF